MKLMPGSKADWNNFNISRIPIYKKWINKIAPSILIRLSFSVNIDFDFVRKAFSQ